MKSLRNCQRFDFEKLGKRDKKNQTPNTTLKGVASQHADCHSTDQGGDKEDIVFINDLREFLFRKEGKRNSKRWLFGKKKGCEM